MKCSRQLRVPWWVATTGSRGYRQAAFDGAKLSHEADPQNVNL